MKKIVPIYDRVYSKGSSPGPPKAHPIGENEQAAWNLVELIYT